MIEHLLIASAGIIVGAIVTFVFYQRVLHEARDTIKRLKDKLLESER